MVKIRLQRVGAKKQPKYRIVVSDEQTKRGGKVIEILGHYNPMTKESDISLDQGRFDHWVGVGAQPTHAVSSIAKTFAKQLAS